MGFWVKKFIDGIDEMGSNEAIRIGRASWTRGRLHGIKTVYLTHGLITIGISGQGEYHQSDTYESQVGINGSKMIARRVERKIVRTDRHFSIFTLPNSLHISFNQPELPNTKIITVKKDMFDKWLIAEINLKSNTMRYYIRSERL
jgi:hypothetical protein